MVSPVIAIAWPAKKRNWPAAPGISAQRPTKSGLPWSSVSISASSSMCASIDSAIRHRMRARASGVVVRQTASAGAGGGDGGIHVGAAGEGDARDLRAGGRIDRREGAAVGRGAPARADQQAGALAVTGR